MWRAARPSAAAQKPDPQHVAPREPITVRPVPARGLTAVARARTQRRRPTLICAQVNVADLVSVGSSLKFCLVAAGEADLYPRLGPPWNGTRLPAMRCSPPRAARCSTLDGAPLRYGKPEFPQPSFHRERPVAPLPVPHEHMTTTQHALSLHLKRLEAESIAIIREVAAEFRNPVMLYSIGKDSGVMLHLAMKAFYPSKPPFPLLHVDTTLEIPRHDPPPRQHRGALRREAARRTRTRKASRAASTRSPPARSCTRR